MANIRKNLRGYICDEREKNWAREFAAREISKHKKSALLDHPDGCVTSAKLADGCINEKKLDNSVIERFNTLLSEINLLHSSLNSETTARKTADALKADKANSLSEYGIEDAYTKSETNEFLNKKVDMVEGMGLSSNDFTNEEKTQLKAFKYIKITKPEDWSLLETKEPFFAFVESPHLPFILAHALQNSGDFTKHEFDYNSSIGEITKNAMIMFSFPFPDMGDDYVIQYFLCDSSYYYRGIGVSSSVTYHFMDKVYGGIEFQCYKIDTISEKSPSTDNYPCEKAVVDYVTSVTKNISNISVITSITDNTLTLENNQEAFLGELTELILTIPENTDTLYQSNFSFRCGTNATVIDDNAVSLKFIGDDCNSSYKFTPSANTSYEVSVKKLGDDIVARVGAY